MASRAWWQRYDVVVPLTVLGAIVGLDVALGSDVILSGTYAIAAVVASTLCSVRRTAYVAALALALALVSSAWNANAASLDWVIRVVLTLGLGALAVGTAALRERRERALRHMTVIAETAQRAVLRAMPTAVGSLGLAARYVSATEEASVGGDLYEVAETPYGVRVIVGDVRGKGLEAVQMAATVLAAFRRAAFQQPSLSGVACDLDRVVTAVAGDEDFVTALLAEFHDDDSVTLVNCGHHPPLLVSPGRGAAVVETGEPEPPLGLGPTPSPATSRWAEGSRMLIYTDGLVEARDGRGEFFPLDDVAELLQRQSGDEALDALLRLLSEYAGHRLDDDIALVLAEHRAGSREGTRAGGPAEVTG